MESNPPGWVVSTLSSNYWPSTIVCPAVCWIQGASLVMKGRGRRAEKAQFMGFDLDKARKIAVDPCPT